jgi:hypothetical protein
MLPQPLLLPLTTQQSPRPSLDLHPAPLLLLQCLGRGSM